MSEPAQAPCPVCEHSAEVRYGPDLRFQRERDRMLMWRAQCAAPDLCGAPTYTRFTRGEAIGAWNTYAERNQ